MLHTQQAEVVVVGAGPVGMLTALLLSKAGVQVNIIDRETRTASRTYACALHPRTLELTDRLGLTRDILAAGRMVNTVAIYEGATRRAELRLSQLPARCPYIVVLAQSAFESLLEERLRTDGKVHVHWNHQLSGLRRDGETAVAIVDEMAVSAKGYIVPEMDWSVQRTEELRAKFVIGADGPSSFVAQSLGFGRDRVGESEFFAVFEFESNWECSDELRIVLDKGLKSILWPLPGNRFRWSFQLREEHLQEFPAKERNSILVGQAGLDEANRAFMQKLIKARAPWFEGSVDELGWSSDVEFEHRLSKRFGLGHCWLVGDAAHQTGPAGMQSMNVGLLEAERLADALCRILRENGSPELLEQYNQVCHDEWRQLLGMTGPPKVRSATSGWIKEHRADLLSCLPSSGEHLKLLLDQLQLDLA